MYFIWRIFSTISSWLEHKRIFVYLFVENFLVTWARKEFAYGMRLSVIEFNRKYMKLTKFDILVNETAYLFTSIRDSNSFTGCAIILETLEGWGGWILRADFGKSRGEGVHTANPFCGDGYGYFLEPHNYKKSSALRFTLIYMFSCFRNRGSLLAFSRLKSVWGSFAKRTSDKNFSETSKK